MSVPYITCLLLPGFLRWLISCYIPTSLVEDGIFTNWEPIKWWGWPVIIHEPENGSKVRAFWGWFPIYKPSFQVLFIINILHTYSCMTVYVQLRMHGKQKRTYVHIIRMYTFIYAHTHAWIGPTLCFKSFKQIQETACQIPRCHQYAHMHINPIPRTLNTP